MRPKALIIAALAWSWPTLVSAGQPNRTQTDNPKTAWGDLSHEAILTALEVDYELWLEAQLAGHREEAAEMEKELLSLVNRDIYAHQEWVREMARKVVLSGESAVNTESPSTPSDSIARRADFQQSMSTLNAKEALYRSMKKTDAFSNKYRLLGDYIDLLRRELDMPRLKLANSRSSTNSESENETTLKPR